LQGADLTGAQLQGANLGDAQFQAANLSSPRLQGASLELARLQGANLSSAQSQGADLTGALLQGADLTGAQLQGVDLSKADLAYSDLAGTFVFRTNITHANLADASIRDVQADQLKPGKNGATEHLSQPGVDAWIAAALQFAAEGDKEAIRKRFERLKLNSGTQSPEQDATDEARWSEKTKQQFASDPDGANHREQLTKLLGNLACGVDGAPDVARGLSRWDVDPSEARLASLGDHLDIVRERMKEGRKIAEKCAGVVGFTEDDWERLDAKKPE